MNAMHKSFFAMAITSGLALFNVAQADTTAAERGSGASNPYIGEDSGSIHLSRQPWASTRTRAEVVAELKAAQQRGEVAAMTCEDSGSAYLARQGQTAEAARVASR
jgi:Domain of unknown function (DUF4148)